MGVVPIDPTLMKAYRDTLAIPSSPSFIDTDLPIQPVAVVANSTQTASGAQFVRLTDGTDNGLVNTDGSILVTNLPKPTTGQTLVSDSNGKGGTSITAGTGLALRTVTSGKTFYLTGFSGRGPSANTNFELRDNGVGGTLKMGGTFLVNSITWSYPTPIPFTTNLFIDVGTTGTYIWAYSGWEE